MASGVAAPCAFSASTARAPLRLPVTSGGNRLLSKSLLSALARPRNATSPIRPGSPCRTISVRAAASVEAPAQDEGVLVSIDNAQDDTFTVVTISGYNRPGLLTSISGTFRDLGLDVGKVIFCTTQRSIAPLFMFSVVKLLVVLCQCPAMERLIGSPAQAEVDGSNGRVLDKFFVTAVRQSLSFLFPVLVALWALTFGCSLFLRCVLQVGGGKVTDAKDIDKLRASLERLVSPAGRSLARVSSGKRPVVGDGVVESAPQNKTLLYNLMGMCLMHAAAVDANEIPVLFHDRCSRGC